MKSVVVTGFGPFSTHQVNSSWESVKLLPDMMLEDLNIRLTTVKVPVVYSVVDSVIPKLWEEHKPDLMVHSGVSRSARCITLESCAYKSGYLQPDVHSCVIEDKMCKTGTHQIIKTGFDLQKIVDKGKNAGMKFIISDDANKYLCEYIYYTSLSINKNCCVFLHVPTLGEYYTAEKLANEIKFIIQLLLQQLEENHDTLSNEE